MLVPHSDVVVEGPQPMEGFFSHSHIHSNPKFPSKSDLIQNLWFLYEFH